ncbi:ferric-chelate reductase [Marchantia polymorpha subsp. ruderalis]|uniref:FAD-binding FR-type domain-containing protein n=2 Tax=Marchantia polymorpha TaxID=3197 RepID=A0A176VRZ0_MARPO|nr:hypothetical protein AXG93_1953s1330 [Marchantia polymorpha subsp. ruderalis]PTQ27549.1 hypothetical protein MARPO_0193s0014 [Marchantia polymorpha]BBN10085.1 hypothetical protein Mp_5g00830 [Marchantia polymorpha subsp. ruderalis]|eukprot:PTQ27549.1 hypothetical protein MARPO_0193s0014 [Marchantia polymorpha]
MATYVKGASQVSLALQVLMGLAFIWWWMFWFLQPIQTARNWLRKADAHISQDFLGTRGSTWLLQVFPFMVIAFLSYFAIVLKGRIKPSARNGTADQKPKVSIWSQPIILKSPLGMLTLADIVFLLVNVFVIAFYLIKMSVDSSKSIDNAKPEKGDPSKGAQKLGSIGVYLGKAALIPFALLWIPVSRGSPFLRVTGVPFERAVKYHTWLGLMCVWLLVAHGLAFFAYFPSIHHTSELWRWQHQGIAYLPGIIALAAGLVMLATALEKVRRNHFNIFFLTHHLYLVFLLFFLFHCVSQMVYVVTPILLFFLDRFIRLVQSRRSVDILSTRVLPSGAIELKFAKPGNLEYNALSFMYVLVPSISKFEWHPFSVASSPLDGTNQICIYIKPLGTYTKDVHDALIDTKHHKEAGKLKCPFGFKLQLEGPYGDESNFYLKYNSLILVAGGIGVTPFLAILKDILHRHKLRQENLPTSIHLIFCVRNQKDLCLLDTINPSEILPNYEDLVQIRIHAFVTSKVDLIKDEELNSSEAIVPYQHYNYTYMNEPSKQYTGPPLAAVREMSILAGAGDNKWVAATFFATMIGYIVIFGIINTTGAYNKLTNYDRALLYCVVLLLSVVGCGGPVLLLWAYVQKRKSPQSNSQVLANSLPPSPDKDSPPSEGDIELRASEHTSWEGEVSLGKRPDWKVFFADMARQFEGKNVGVLVSGASKMQEDVATECKNHTNSNNSNVAFHYHSVSFEL